MLGDACAPLATQTVAARRSRVADRRASAALVGACGRSARGDGRFARGDGRCAQGDGSDQMASAVRGGDSGADPAATAMVAMVACLGFAFGFVLDAAVAAASSAAQVASAAASLCSTRRRIHEVTLANVTSGAARGAVLGAAAERDAAAVCASLSKRRLSYKSTSAAPLSCCVPRGLRAAS